MRTPQETDFLPSKGRLADLLEVKEEYNLWVRGTMVLEPEVTVEISFEEMQGGTPFPGTYVTYLGMWRRGRRATVFEFQLGKLVHKPKEHDWERLVRPLVERLQGYRPIRVGEVRISRTVAQRLQVNMPRIDDD